MLDLSNLSNESYAAFVLAIVFTIITLAGAIIILRRSFKTSTVIKVLTTIVFPFIAIFCWLYMILDTCSTLNSITSLYSSFLITLGFYLIVIAIYFITVAAIKKKKEKDLAYMKSLEIEVEDLEKTLSEKEKENAELNNTEENEIVIPEENNDVENNNVEEESNVESENVEETDANAQDDESQENEVQDDEEAPAQNTEESVEKENEDSI